MLFRSALSDQCLDEIRIEPQRCLVACDGIIIFFLAVIVSPQLEDHFAFMGRPGMIGQEFFHPFLRILVEQLVGTHCRVVLRIYCEQVLRVSGCHDKAVEFFLGLRVFLFLEKIESVIIGGIVGDVNLRLLRGRKEGDG